MSILEEWSNAATVIVAIEEENKRLRAQRDELFSENGKLANTIGAENLRLRAQRDQLLAALQAVDALWDQDALEFPQEMAAGSPVGIAWSKVRAAIAAAER